MGYPAGCVIEIVRYRPLGLAEVELLLAALLEAGLKVEDGVEEGSDHM